MRLRLLRSDLSSERAPARSYAPAIAAPGSDPRLAPSAAAVSEAPSGNASPDGRGPCWPRLSCGAGGFGCSAARAFCPENRDLNEGASSLWSFAETVHCVGNLPTTNSASIAAEFAAEDVDLRDDRLLPGLADVVGISRLDCDALPGAVHR